VDQYPDVTVSWKLHHKPVLHGYDASGKEIRQIDLSPLRTEGLHALFSRHFRRAHVDPPSLFVRTWRRLFGWAYGMSDLEAALMFACAGIVLLLSCYTLCFRYTQCCDALSDI